MKDILGREIKDEDMVVGKGTGRYVKSMRVGMMLGKSIIYKDGSRSIMSDVYLIEHPGALELEIKKKIMDHIRNEYEKAVALKERKTIPLSKLEVGGVYTDRFDVKWLFLGKRNVKVEQIYGSSFYKNEIVSDNTGNCFLHIGKINEKLYEDIFKRIKLVDGNGSAGIDIIKGNKKLYEKLGKIDLVFPLEQESEHYRYLSSKPIKYKITIE